MKVPGERKKKPESKTLEFHPDPFLNDVMVIADFKVWWYWMKNVGR